MHFEEAGGMEEATRENPARLLIADDHALVREGLRTMLSGEDGIQVVAEANNGQEALSMCRDLRPDLVLMDVRMPVMDGLEATRRIKEEMPQTSVVMVTMHENPDYLFEAVKAGAAGYVLKDASGERLLGAVRRTLEGESPLNQELAMRLLVRLARERGEGGNRQGGSQEVEAGTNSSGAGPDEEIPAPEAAGEEAEGAGQPGRGGPNRDPHAQGDRGPHPPKPGPDEPPDRPEPYGQPRHRQDPRPAHNLQTRSLRPNPGRRPRHRGRGNRDRDPVKRVSTALRALSAGSG